MHTHNHIHSPHSKEIAARLQKEVDAILEVTTDKTLHAEFKESEVVEIQGGVQHDIVRESIDARIDVKLQKKHTPTHTHTGAHKRDKTQKVLNFFFKRFEV